ncbi:MAG: right-handed parallel beta-helix repeat-containing protein, partial [Candidatus ainarchaeum sp.]|nr:right-handed parallel beta-helix repeat-containing protein [Candidatus ainarchaeum sp.]
MRMNCIFFLLGSLLLLNGVAFAADCPAPIAASANMTDDYAGAPNNASPLSGTACVKIAASNVVFDCAGFSITNNGTAGTTYGILLNGSLTNVTVRNCRNVSQYTTGVYAYQSNNTTVANSNAYNNSNTGFYLDSSNNNTLANNTAILSGTGFRLVASSGNNITGNAAYNGSPGVQSNGNFNSFANNIVCFSGPVAFSASGSNNSLINNTVCNTTGDSAFYLSSLSDSILVNNSAYDNVMEGYYLEYASGNTVINNTAYRNRIGFAFDSSPSNTVANNTAYNNANSGFSFTWDSTGNNATNNSAYNNANGFFLYGTGCDGNTLANNSAYGNNQSGFSLNASVSGNLLSGNLAWNNTRGFQLYDSSSNTLANNTAYNNTLGIYNLDSNNTVISGGRLLGNGMDFRLDKAAFADFLTINLEQVVFGNASANTTLSINNTIEALIGNYTINWSNGTGTLPPDAISFAGKYLLFNISNVWIDNATWSWSDGELAGYNETNFQLFRHNGSGWSSVPFSVLNTSANTLSSSLSENGTYGIFDSNMSGMPPMVEITRPGYWGYENISGTLMQFVGGVYEVWGRIMGPDVGNWSLSAYLNDIYNATICDGTGAMENGSMEVFLCNWTTASFCAGECENYSLVLNASGSSGYNETHMPNLTIDNVPPSISLLSLQHYTSPFSNWLLRVNVTDRYLWMVTPFVLDNQSNIAIGWGDTANESQGTSWDLPASGSYNVTWGQDTYSLDGQNVSAYFNFGFPDLGNDSPTASVPGCLKPNASAPWDCEGWFSCGENCSKPYRMWLIYNLSGGDNKSLLGITSEQWCTPSGCALNTSLISPANDTGFIPQLIHFNTTSGEKTYNNNSNITVFYPANSSSNLPLVWLWTSGGYFMGYEARDYVNADIASWNVSVDTQGPMIDARVANPDIFFSSYDGLVNLSVNATDPGGVATVTADFSEINDSACGGIFNLTYDNATGLWGGTCNISQYIAHATGINFTFIFINATDNGGNWNVNGTGILVHNLGVPDMGNGTNCTRFGNLTTNFTRELDFNRINFIIQVEGNMSCMSGNPGAPTSFGSMAVINLTSVNLSTQESADKLRNLGFAIRIDIGSPHSFQPSVVYVNTSYFQELDTNATVSMYKLPFASQPPVVAENSSRQAGISNISWSPGYTQAPSGGTCYLNTSAPTCTGKPHVTCDLMPWCNWTGSSCVDIVPSCSAFIDAPSCMSTGKCLWSPGYVPQGNLTFSVGGFSGYNVSENLTPIISIISPANGSVMLGSRPLAVNLTVNGTGTEPSYILIILNYTGNQYSYDASSGNVTNNTANCSAVSPGSELYRCTFNTTSIPPGAYGMAVLAYDFASPPPGNNATNMSTFTLTALAPDAYEPDDSLGQANWIPANGSMQRHNFHSTSDVDYVKFNATAGYTYIVQTVTRNSSGIIDTEMALFNASGTALAYSDDIVTGVNVSSRIMFRAAQNGTYYVGVDELYGNAGGVYDLFVQQQGILISSIINVTSSSLRLNGTFNITTTTQCIGGPCGNVTATLDPLPGIAPAGKLSLQGMAARDGSVPVIVKLKDVEPAGQASIAAAMGDSQAAVLSTLSAGEFQPVYRYTIINGFSGRATPDGLQKLLDNPAVESVSYDRELHIALDVSVPHINAPEVWNITVNGSSMNGTGQTVCIIDTGINYTHPDFGGYLTFPNAKVVGGYDYINNDSNPMDDNGHGSHVAGIVASMDATYRGVAPGAKIAMVKVCNAGGSCPGSAMLAGIQWCANNASLFNISAISISIGGGAYEDGWDCDTDDPAMASAINSAVAHNLTVVLSSGNGINNDGNGMGYSNPGGLSWPACIKSALSVGATDDSDAIATFTNRNNQLDLLAPGVGIIATDYSSTGHTTKSGTSMAAPHVSGLTALMNQYYLAEYGRMPTPHQLELVMKRQGAPVLDSTGRNPLAYPRIDAITSVLGKGVVSNVTGARPFYTTSSNPATGSCLNNMQNGTSCNSTWRVVATGDNGNYEFFTIYETAYDTFYTGNRTITIFLSNLTNCSVINESGDYQLTTNLSGAPNNANITAFPVLRPGKACIVIAGSNIVFDCNGRSITNNGTAGNTTGIFLNGSLNNVTIKNCNVNNYTYGIDVYNSNNSVVINNNVRYSGSRGIEVEWNSNFNTLINNTANNNLYGFDILVSSNNNLTNNSASSNNVRGFQIGSASNSNTFTNNSAFNNSDDGFIFYNDSGSYLANNRAYNNALHGFFLSSQSNDTLYGNSAHNNSGAGFYLQSSSVNRLSNNSAYNNTNFGFDLGVLSDTNLTNNIAFRNLAGGTYVLYSNRTRLVNEHYYNNSVEFQIYASTAPLTLNVSTVIFDNPAGNFQNLTNLSINDSMEAGTSYNISWTNISALPTGYNSFANKFINLSNPALNVSSIDTIVWTWTNAEVSAGGYNESRFVLSMYNASGWTRLNASPNTAANTLSLSGLTASGIIGILQSNDTVAPNVTLVAPADGNISTSASVMLTFNATDDVDTTMPCRIYINGALNATVTATNGTPYDLTQSYADGNYTWYVNCSDSANNSGAATPRVFLVDVLSPAITIISPVNNTLYGNATIRVNISAVDVHLRSTWFFNGTANETYTTSVLRTFTEGNHNLTAWANDTAGHLSTAFVNFTVDTIYPTINFVSPTSNSSSSLLVDFIVVNVSASDSLLDNLTIRLYNSS